MRRQAVRIVLWLLAMAALITMAALHGPHHVFAMVDSAGPVGDRERKLMLYAVLMGVVVLVPVFTLLFVFAWRYRDGGHKRAKYTPDVDGNPIAETIWWLIPTVIIAILSVLAWTSSHELDPFKPLASTQPALPVQVVAMDWKWLFLYPEQHVATVNYLEIPTNRPVSFSITSDAPMNSFWIPQLGGQIYAMSGMTTKLQLQADKTGDYYGSSANISGDGFAGMHFWTHAVAPKDFANWAHRTRNGGGNLTSTEYAALSKPSVDDPPTSYGRYDSGLFNQVVMKYMGYSSTEVAL